MTILIFKNSKMQGIFRFTQQNTIFIHSFSEAVKAYEKATNKKYKYNTNINQYYEHSTPTLWLIKDVGIYLMTAAKIENPKDFSHVCYAEGFHPDSPHCWDRSRKAVGSDDFVESFQFDDQLQKEITQGADIHIEFNINNESYTVRAVYPGSTKPTK